MDIDLDSDTFTKLTPEKTYICEIPTIENRLCTYNNFFNNYLIPNQPCLIKNISLGWLSTKHWINNNNELNYKYLYTKYGLLDITAYNCDEKYYNSQKTSKMKFMNYLVYWEAYLKSKYSLEFPLLYLKDWHLKNQCPDDLFYEVPLYFASDWLNEYFVENHKDDYRFVYLGPKGTWTPFHADVFTSFSWSVNIFGTKRWVLFPPGEENHLKDGLGNLPYDIDGVKNNVKHVEIIQEAGDGVFVPSGWHHQVWNLQDTISINHNWVNGCNLKMMWLDLEKNLHAVKNEIDDCRDMDDFNGHAQVMLKASYGLDFHAFYEFVEYIFSKRLQFIKGECVEICLDGGFILGKNHAVFDLKCIQEVFKLFVCNEDVKLLGLDTKVNELLENINFITE